MEHFGIVEHSCGTFWASWNIFLRDMLLRPSRNNRARPGVEQFAHRGTISWNNFGIVEHFFFKKKFDFIFFAVKLRAVSWNNSRTVEQFAVPTSFF